MKVRADNLKPGDLIDLEGDEYATMAPTTSQGVLGSRELEDHDLTVSTFEFEYAEVESVVAETAECVVVHTDATSFGCPPDHMIELASSKET